MYIKLDTEGNDKHDLKIMAVRIAARQNLYTINCKSWIQVRVSMNRQITVKPRMSSNSGVCQFTFPDWPGLVRGSEMVGMTKRKTSKLRPQTNSAKLLAGQGGKISSNRSIDRLSTT